MSYLAGLLGFFLFVFWAWHQSAFAAFADRIARWMATGSW
jgi:hypothetical protein